jgi:enterochelin esterase-like enzyme
MVSLAALIFASSVGFSGQSQSRLSPIVNADRTVTFRFVSPNAKKVSVGIEGNGNLELVRRSDGVWEGISKPLKPDIYGYGMNVDGVTMFDPMNPEIKSNLIYVSNMVTVPGDPPEFWEVQNVPHGQITQHFYKSTIIGDQRDYLVYTPPGYRSGRGNLPVLYLLHGYSDIANGWTVVGKAHVILDNLISQRKVKPMVIVMTLGYGVPGFASHETRAFSDRSLTTKNFTLFRQSLLEEVIPRVERDYPVSKKQSDRAIAGLSMGGAESLFTGLNNVDKFAHVGAFSSGGLPAAKPEEVFSTVTKESTKGLKTFWMTCGTGDGRINVKTNETPGGHEWLLWRRNLAEFAQMIFK